MLLVVVIYLKFVLLLFRLVNIVVVGVSLMVSVGMVLFRFVFWVVKVMVVLVCID